MVIATASVAVLLVVTGAFTGAFTGVTRVLPPAVPMRFRATLVGPEVLPFPLFRLIGCGCHFSGCLPLMEDTAMHVQCGIVLVSIA
jgi:hypothetical protein